MKKLLFALLVLCLFCTCKKDIYSGLCGGRNPIENLPWLKARIDTLQKSNSHYVIKRGVYQSQTIFLLINTCTNCNSVNQAFDCDGSLINFTSEQYQYIYFSPDSVLTQIQTVWQN